MSVCNLNSIESKIMYSRLEFGIHGAVAFLISSVTIPLWYLIRFLFNYSEEYLVDSNFNGNNYLVVITGGNCGVGKQTARKFLLSGAKVIIGCRDQDRGLAAVESLEKDRDSSDKGKYPNSHKGQIIYLPLDLCDLSSIRKFANVINTKYKCVDILINNGGVNTKGITPSGLQQLFAVNYLGHYYLYRMLEESLFRMNQFLPSIQARVVNLSSIMHHTGDVDYNTSAFCIDGSEISRSCYSDSKLYLNFLTISINHRNKLFQTTTNQSKSRAIFAVSVNPGAVRSDIWRGVSFPFNWAYDIVMRGFFLNCEQGAETSVFGGVAPLTLTTSSSLDEQRLHQHGRFCDHPLLPYVVPYSVFFNVLSFESIGPFTGAKWGLTTLPPKPMEIATGLWEFSEDLINSMLAKSSSPTIC